MVSVWFIFILMILLCRVCPITVATLSSSYYDKTCPDVDSIVTKVMKKGILNDRRVPAAILRMHFHDCFVRGCDGSVLLNSTAKNEAEKDGPPNISLHAFYVIDHIKTALESACPGVVSCADILAIAARDAVALSGGPSWKVEKGRKDGRISKATDTIQLPAPTLNISQLQLSFSQRNLSLQDLVALSGGHSLGFAHCSSFQDRIHNFNKKVDVDPSLDPSFAASLRKECPMHNTVRSAGSILDPSPTIFDNTYYKRLLQGKSIFTSDQSLLTTSSLTKSYVTKFATSQQEFYGAFANSMIKMARLPGNAHEVRLHCRFVN